MFRFSIRELMLVTVVIAFGLGWWIEHRQRKSAEESKELAEWQLDSVARLAEGQGHRVTIYDGWKVELAEKQTDGSFLTDSISGESTESLREVPRSWR